tara:strand:- start:2095 stop:4527 length:2433 start_codon:yes stop_codon:yes gene_type:complete
MEILKLEQRLEGAIGGRGKFLGYKPKNAKGEFKKDAKYEHQHMDWERHFSGKDYLGISPVKIIFDGSERKGLCRWVAWDLDIEEIPEKFCRAVFRIATDLFCYKTSSNRWHIHKYFDEFISVDDAYKIAQDYQKKFKSVWPKDVDTSHSLPKGYTVAENKPGGWLFMPYCPHEDLQNKNLVGYSPSGQPLTKEQVEFAIHFREEPIIRSLVGTTSGQGGREKFLLIANQVIRHKKLDLNPLEVNDQFTESLAEDEAISEVEKHNNKDWDNEFTPKYLKDHYEKYLYEINGYHRKELKGVGVLDGFLNEEQEEETTQFLKDVMYIKLDDLWYDKSTGQEYKQKAIQVSYGHIFKGKISDVLTNFVAFKGAQQVEKGVYRPDLFESIDNPIVKDEKGLLQLNQYRPSEVIATPPDTPQLKQHLENFKELIKRLTEKEGTGTDSKGNEINLYDYVLDHLSMPFQQPGNKVRSALLFHSENYQVGKNTFYSIVQEGLGLDNCAVVTPEEAIDRGRTFLENQLVLIDEILIDGDYKKKISTLNVLKPLMTNEIHSCRPLFKNWRQVFSTCGFMAFTNHKDAMAFDMKEARYTTIDIDKDREEMGGDEFFEKFWSPDGKLNDGLVGVVKWFLSTREISEDFNPKSICLKTNFLETMSKEGGHPLLRDLEPLFKERATPFYNTVISIAEAFKFLKREHNIPGRINDLADALKKLGCERVGEVKHRKSGKHPTYWLVRNQDFFCDKTMSSIANKYWQPIGSTPEKVPEEWNLSQGDLNEIKGGLEEIEAYEEFHRGAPKEDPEEDFETIRRARKTGSC